MVDIILNFFIKDISSVNKDPLLVAQNYMIQNFIPDIIAVLPYSSFAPKFIFLRFVKVI